MKRILFSAALMGIVITSCTQNHKPDGAVVDSLKKDSLAKAYEFSHLPAPDTVIVAFVYKNSYSMTKALRTISKQPKITDTIKKTFDYLLDTTYTFALPDTLKDASGNVLKDKAGKVKINTIYNASVKGNTQGFWPLLPH